MKNKIQEMNCTSLDLTRIICSVVKHLEGNSALPRAQERAEIEERGSIRELSQLRLKCHGD